MTTAPPAARTNSLALAFQDVITVVLRMRYGAQRVADAAGFRANIRKMIAAAVQDIRAMGYSDATSHMALYAIIGFLDESVLNSQDPTFADWARRPLQEEMFGGHFAGEVFFKQVADLLNAHESPEVADALELHAICLLLGYRGRYAFGDHGEIHGILQRIREKILRIRGPLALARLSEVPEVKFAPRRDRWMTALWVTAAALLLLTIALYAIYALTLGSGLGAIQAASLIFLLRLEGRSFSQATNIPALTRLSFCSPVPAYLSFRSEAEESAFPLTVPTTRVPHVSLLRHGFNQTQTLGCPTFATVSSSLRWANAAHSPTQGAA